MSSNCGSEDSLKEIIFKALNMENLKAEVNFYRIDSEQAIAIGLRGSPSVLVDGEDIQPIDITGFS